LKKHPTETSQAKTTKRSLRANIRRQRRALSTLQQKKASVKLLSRINTCQLLLGRTDVALYLGNDGEICPKLLIQRLWKYKKKAYLPVIHPLKKQQIIFCCVTPHTLFKKNRFGIEEPIFKYTQRLQANRLSLVLLPLVAFDDAGNRMGMGGGFYDRAFAFKHHKENVRPRLVGLAHDFQKQESLPVEPWDVPLYGVITEKYSYI